MTDETTKVFQDEARETTPENNNKTRKIATAAGIAAGALGIGGAVGYAATREPDEPAETPEEPVAEEPKHEPEPKVVERVIVRETPAPQPAPQEDDNQITYDVDSAEVQVIEVGQNGEGGYYATANIDGHAAVYVDGDGDGKVDVLGIDVNSNGSLESNEIMDVSDRNISMHSLAAVAHGPENPQPTPVGPDPQPTEINASEIHVGNVEHNVEIGGRNTDVATIQYRGHAGVMADVDQDGRADVAMIDMNDNGNFEDEEIHDIQHANVSMNGNNTINVSDSEINASEIHVGQVTRNVEIGGRNTDVATVEYRGHAGVMADVDQDGRADVAMIDMNDNGNFEDQEIHDIQHANVSMNGNNSGAISVSNPEPEPEPEPYNEPMGNTDPIAATDGLPDYTNGGDIDGYII